MDEEKGDEKQKEPLSHQMTTDQVTPVNSAGKTSQEQENCQTPKSRFFDGWTKQDVFSGILAVFTIIYTVISVWQGCISQEAMRATKLSADADAAAARAWITFWRGQFAGVKDSRVQFGISLKNAGATPATSVTITWKVSFIPGPDIHAVQKPEYATCPSENVTTLGVIEAQTGWAIVVPSDPLPDVERKMLTDKTAHLFIYGCAKYHDVLVPEEERLTEIGLIYPSTLPGTLFTMDPRYNRMR